MACPILTQATTLWPSKFHPIFVEPWSSYITAPTPPQKTKSTMEKNTKHLKMYLLLVLKMVIFQQSPCYPFLEDKNAPKFSRCQLRGPIFSKATSSLKGNLAPPSMLRPAASDWNKLDACASREAKWDNWVNIDSLYLLFLVLANILCSLAHTLMTLKQ